MRKKDYDKNWSRKRAGRVIVVKNGGERLINVGCEDSKHQKPFETNISCW
jgi:hypothetical protein